MVCDPSRDIAGATDFVGFIHRQYIERICIFVVLSAELIRWTQAASGAAGRANVGLCDTASSFNRKTPAPPRMICHTAGHDVEVIVNG